VSKKKEMIVGYKKRRAEQATIYIDRAEVERVESLKFLGVHITNKLSRSKHLHLHTKTVMKRARQHLSPSGDWNNWVPKSSKNPDWFHHRLVWQLLEWQAVSEHQV
jgi:hypothetical protein